MTSTVKNGRNTEKDTRFKPGNGGRPKGSRNRRTAWCEEITSDRTKEIIKAVADKAAGGDMAAAKLILDRIWPAPKGVTAQIRIPDIQGSGGIKAAMAAIVGAMGRGEIDATTAQQMATVIEGHRKAIDQEELLERLATLEEKVGKK